MLSWSRFPHPPFLCCLTPRTWAILIGLTGAAYSAFAAITRHYAVKTLDAFISFDLVFSIAASPNDTVHTASNSTGCQTADAVLDTVQPFYIAAAPSHCWAVFLAHLLLAKGAWYDELCSLAVWLGVKAVTVGINVVGSAALSICYDVGVEAAVGQGAFILVQMYLVWIVVDQFLLLQMVNTWKTDELLDIFVGSEEMSEPE